MVEGGSSEEVCAGDFRQKLGPRVESFESQLVILVLTSDEGQVTIRIAIIRLELYCLEQLVLRFGKLLLMQQSDPKTAVKLRIVGVTYQQSPIGALSLIVLSCPRQHIG